jgi:hypothetical protein
MVLLHGVFGDYLFSHLTYSFCQPRVAFINRIEPKWVHGKRAIVEPARLPTAQEVIQRACDHFGCEQLEPLTQQVA